MASVTHDDGCRVGAVIGKHDEMQSNTSAMCLNRHFFMPATQTHRSTTCYRDRRCNDPNHKTYIQDTLTEVTTNQHLSLRQAARKTGVSEVLYNVLWKVFMASV